jgi:glutamyl endopeptidase
VGGTSPQSTHRRRLWWLPLALIAAWLMLLNWLAPPPREGGAADSGTSDQSRIIGPDERVPVSDTRAYPYAAIGQVRAFWGAQGYAGTGVLVGPDRIVTAAHCAYRAELGGWPDLVMFVPGRNATVRPYGTVQATRFVVPIEYTQTALPRYDVAVVTLETAVGEDTGWLPLAAADLDPAGLVNLSVHSAGYPADAPGGAPADSLFAADGSLLSYATGLLQTDVDAVVGQSGSPIWFDDPSDGSPVVAAILVAELDNGQANLAVPVTAQLLSTVGIASDDPDATATEAADLLVGAPAGPTAGPLPLCGAGVAQGTFACLFALGLLSMRHRCAARASRGG